MKLYLDLRHIIQSSFLPLSCQCLISPAGAVSVRITHPDTGRVDLLDSSFNAAELTSSRSIANMVAELRTALAAGNSGKTKGRAHG